MLKALRKNITNGLAIILLGLVHAQFVATFAFPEEFARFKESNFYKISMGMAELPAAEGKTDFPGFSAFWFLYFGIFMIPLGVIVHSIERKGQVLAHSFTISYLLIVALGAYMIPNSGITRFMLPHAVFMLGWNAFKGLRLRGKEENS